jgi:drug/metabolite transporter (DMT)-like permease
VAAAPAGIALAVVSGALTSGLGYALWYSVLPSLGPSDGAVAQLTVPIFAVVGGMAFLGEALTLRFAIAAVMVLGGVGWALRRR